MLCELVKTSDTVRIEVKEPNEENIMQYRLTTQQVIDSQEHRKFVEVIESNRMSLEIDANIYKDIDWQEQANKLIQERAVKMILGNLDSDLLLELATGDFDMAELIKTVNPQN